MVTRRNLLGLPSQLYARPDTISRFSSTYTPRNSEDVMRIIRQAKQQKRIVVDRALVEYLPDQTDYWQLDFSVYYHQIISFDESYKLLVVEPGASVSSIKTCIQAAGLRCPILPNSPEQDVHTTIGQLLFTGKSLPETIVAYLAGVEVITTFGTVEWMSTFDIAAASGLTSQGQRMRISQIFTWQAEVAAQLPFPSIFYRFPAITEEGKAISHPHLARISIGSWGTLFFLHRIYLRLTDRNDPQVGIESFPPFPQQEANLAHPFNKAFKQLWDPDRILFDPFK